VPADPNEEKYTGGAPEETTAVGADVLDADPAELVAVTITRSEYPSVSEFSGVVDPVAPGTV
jgi:hypothetical protein